MLRFKEYYAPTSLDQAHSLLIAHKKAQLIGGGAFLRLGKRQLPYVIDLSKLQLDFIAPGEDMYEIGAMTNFHTLETTDLFTPEIQRFFKDALGQIVGIQLRSMVTVGATLYSRYGFSDLNTALLALGGRVAFYKHEPCTLESYFQHGINSRDIMKSVHIHKNFDFTAFKSARLSTADYALVNMAVSKNGSKWRIAVGARPHRAVLAYEAMQVLNKNPLSQKTIGDAVEALMQGVQFGSNRMASSSYRCAAAGGLLKQILMEAMNHEN